MEREFLNLIAGDLCARPAEIDRERQVAQAAFLAYFYCEMGAEFTAVVARNQIDADKYDPVSDHLIVTLTTVFDIGNYKLIRCAASVRCGGLYSEPELDFGELFA